MLKLEDLVVEQLKCTSCLKISSRMQIYYRKYNYITWERLQWSGVTGFPLELAFGSVGYRGDTSGITVTAWSSEWVLCSILLPIWTAYLEVCFGVIRSDSKWVRNKRSFHAITFITLVIILFTACFCYELPLRKSKNVYKFYTKTMIIFITMGYQVRSNA